MTELLTKHELAKVLGVETCTIDGYMSIKKSHYGFPKHVKTVKPTPPNRHKVKLWRIEDILEFKERYEKYLSTVNQNNRGGKGNKKVDVSPHGYDLAMRAFK